MVASRKTSKRQASIQASALLTNQELLILKYSIRTGAHIDQLRIIRRYGSVTEENICDDYAIINLLSDIVSMDDRKRSWNYQLYMDRIKHECPSP